MDAHSSLVALYPLVEFAARAETPAVAAAAALDALESALGVRRAWVQQVDAAGAPRVLLARGVSAACIAAAEAALPGSHDDPEPGVFETAGAPAGTLLAALRDDGIVRATFVPIRWRSARIGVVALLDADTRPRTDEELKVASAIASLTGIVCGRERVITARHRLEQELLHSQRLESVGRVAGGIAHDFNNMLTAIIGYMDLVVAGLPPDAEEQAYLAQALDAADQATVLTRQMLAFARRQPSPPAAQDLAAVLGRMAPLVRRIMPETIEVNVDTTTPDCWIVADPGQVEQAIVNFAFRARDAMAAGGVLTLATRIVEDDAGRPFVALEASDTGEALDEEVLRNAIEPFRGPPAEGGWPGLALAVAAALVRDCGGEVEAESDPMNGTRVRALWPLASGPGTAPAPSGGAPGGGETLLFVDDESTVRGLASVLLSRIGYTVIAADCADEALRVLGSHAGTLHLMVADLVMPGMGGRDLALRARALRPDLRVMLMSGYSAAPEVKEVAGGFAFLSKPFTGETLARRVRETLDAPPARGDAPRA